MNFYQWLLDTKKISESSAGKYHAAIVGKLSNLARQEGLVTDSIFEIFTVYVFNEIYNKLVNIDEFQVFDEIGHKMYSNALKKYKMYLSNMDVELQNEVKVIIEDKGTAVTEKVNLICSRVGQGKFRSSLINYWKECAVTGYSDVKMTVASHIKPWSVSTNTERLDVYNGLLLIPNIDSAFDLGFISFEETGEIIVSKYFKYHNELGINKHMRISMDKRHMFYMRYHRNKVFLDK